MKLDYIPSLFRKLHVWENSSERDIWAQSCQGQLFSAFFSIFSNLTLELFLVEKTFFLLNLDLIKPDFFHFSEIRYDNFHPNYY